MKGASAIFAWFVSRGEKVTVLSPPPPSRFHPIGLTNFQEIEKPILKGKGGRSTGFAFSWCIRLLEGQRTSTTRYGRWMKPTRGHQDLGWSA